MRSIIFQTVAGLILGISLLFGDVIYQQVRVYYSDPSELHGLIEVGIPLDHVRVKKGVFIDVTATRSQVTELRRRGFQLDIIHENLTEFYKSRFIPSLRRQRGFELGSMGGNYTFDEMVAELDSLRMLYPTLVSEKMSIGLSYEGRPVWAVKLSDNVDEDENVEGDFEPLVLFTGLHHAREPVSMMNLIYFMYYLCDNYGVDGGVTYLVDNRELWFVPVVNPDGYVYNETIEPDGGGMHRKNRRPTCPGNDGIDLNRNYSYNWGYDWGSSGDPCSDVYRGDSPFSETETSALRDFILSKDFKNVLHYHTYSNLLIHSFGSGEYPPEPDLSMLREFGTEMTKFNHYQVGTGPETVGYMVNGDAVDWSYGELDLVAYTPEIGTFSDEFWPPTDRIVPLCEENVYPNSYFATIAGTLLEAVNIELSEEYLDPGMAFAVSFDVKNTGLRATLGSVMATVAPMNEIVSFEPVSVDLGPIDARETVSFVNDLNVYVASGTGIGCQTGLILSMNDPDDKTFVDTIRFIIGRPDILLADDAESGLGNWIPGDWGLATDSVQGDHSFTDSPDGDYAANEFNVLQWSQPFDLSVTANPVLTFWARWDIETNWDFVQVQVSTDGNNWTALSGIHTVPGNGWGVQPDGEPGYHGFQWDWVEETMDLSALAGQPTVYLRFVLMSDWLVERDGFYFDDLKLLAYPDAEIAPGDVNQDCTLDVADILSVVDIILEPESATAAELELADLNSDNIVDVFDIVLIVQLFLGGK